MNAQKVDRYINLGDFSRWAHERVSRIASARTFAKAAASRWCMNVKCDLTPNVCANAFGENLAWKYAEFAIRITCEAWKRWTTHELLVYNGPSVAIIAASAQAHAVFNKAALQGHRIFCIWRCWNEEFKNDSGNITRKITFCQNNDLEKSNW